ncbi:hypothetical protein GOP47_0000894 [Adiantum capillus-veneris]|uniref:Oxidation resistance protein 1 n=1 Tax=Adiantum capillus-veneris TaxID=13818 RepID=A0A9D4VET5_ADICA|nr:hypothetical protein GOP47_0000894 [Adiantum capillus-veneris]
MSWTSNIVGKVGHYLSQSSEKSFQKEGPRDKVEGIRHYAFVNTKTDSLNGGCRPDTSSVTSFLLTLLSSSNARYPRCSQSPEEAPCGSNLIATAEIRESHGHREEQETNSYTQLFGKELPVFGESKELVSNQSELSECALNSALQPPLKLPPMSEDSVLLSEDFRAFLYSALPTIAKDRQWIVLYSTARHGISMRTLYQKSSLLSEPYLLVVGDMKGAIFGGLATAPLKPTAQRRYLGTSNTFVFSNLPEQLQLYTATGANRYYLLCTNDAISFGGGGHFAIHLDDTLLTGSSGACDTFGNPCLATSLEFSVSNVEVWGFAHMLKQAWSG